MTQRELDREVARQTLESVSEIGHRGFSLLVGGTMPPERLAPPRAKRHHRRNHDRRS
jgi:hypothetical protein